MCVGVRVWVCVCASTCVCVCVVPCCPAVWRQPSRILAHGICLLGRDLKSGNVLISRHLHAKITDFGSIRQCLNRGHANLSEKDRRARSRHGRRAVETLLHDEAAQDVPYSQEEGGRTLNLTMTVGVGTPLYMAPEALTGSQYDAKADVFSFGVLLWEIATQREPDLILQEKGPGYRGPMLTTLGTLLGAGKRLRFEGV